MKENHKKVYSGDVSRELVWWILTVTECSGTGLGNTVKRIVESGRLLYVV